ncbi:hypothetical protein RF11_14979 [Thelohanellus kitauei]|uniref:Uncharacterized protein n=1 Tax=Thelohanellus kitauei TaxID=669202 RepID=A0A0C2MQN5_THEKT|nr:hypothetical protein RF11_14979 [Thelohanellus kitauei]
MSLSLMLKTSLNQNVKERFQKIVFLIFGISYDLGNSNVMTVLAVLKKKLDHDIFGSIVEYMMELTGIPNDYFSDVTDNQTDMVNIAKHSLDTVVQDLQRNYKRVVKNKEHPSLDENELANLTNYYAE